MSDPAARSSQVANIESYYGPIMAMRGVSLEVPRGKIVTVLGANGAGKTTILKTISGVLDPQKGSIELEGKPIQRHGPGPHRPARAQPRARGPRGLSRS